MFISVIYIECFVYLILTYNLYSFVVDQLPYSIRVLLESAVRNCDNFHVLEKDVQSILAWTPDLKQGQNDVEVSFKPARVILQVRGSCC